MLDHVELPVLSGVISYTSAVKPVAIVAADIVVNLWKKMSNHDTMGKKGKSAEHNLYKTCYSTNLDDFRN